MKKLLTGIAIVIFCLVVIGFGLSFTKNRDYRAQIRTYNDSISILRENNTELQKCLLSSQERVSEVLNEKESYLDSLDRQAQEFDIIKKRYEKKIANLKFVPTDSLYLQLTDWLDTVSFQ